MIRLCRASIFVKSKEICVSSETRDVSKLQKFLTLLKYYTYDKGFVIDEIFVVWFPVLKLNTMF
jgi:hypothetical protein